MARNVKTSDIISVATMLKVAQIVRKKAAEIAKRKRAPLQSNRKTPNVYNPSLIGIKQPQTTQNQILIELTLSEVAYAFEHGSKPHPILPRNKKALAFHWDKANPDLPRLPDGRVLLHGVNHPGFQAKPFLEPAKRATAQERRKLLEEEAGKNIRTIISGMRRVV